MDPVDEKESQALIQKVGLAPDLKFQSAPDFVPFGVDSSLVSFNMQKKRDKKNLHKKKVWEMKQKLQKDTEEYEQPNEEY